jgi:transposase
MGYYDMITASDKNFSLRKNLVMFALENGIKPAARKFETTVKTVRKWVKRFEANRSHEAFKELSRRPLSSPNKTPPEIEKRVIESRLKAPAFGAERLVDNFDLGINKNTAQRILKQANLTRKVRKKHHSKLDLRAVKAAYEPFTRFQMDTKDLCDIPQYHEQMLRLNLPRYQYSIRELSTGASYWSFSAELSKLYATQAIKAFLLHMQNHSIDTSKVIVTTDCGLEFDGTTVHFMDEGFHKTITNPPFNATHRFNPPARPNFNADVESFHNTVESEFYFYTPFANKNDFLQKAGVYQCFFNLARHNYSRKGSPAQLLHSKKPLLSPMIFLHPPQIFSPDPPSSGGYHVPSLPELIGF